MSRGISKRWRWEASMGFSWLERATLDRIMLQPFQHVAGVSIGWKHRIEHVGYAGVVDDKREPFYQGQSRHLHGWQLERVGEQKLFVRQHRERKMQPRGHLG